MRRVLAAVIFTLWSASAFAQNPGIIYSGASPAANDCVKFINRSLVTTTGAPCAGATAPGGSNLQVQYNNAGAFGGYTNTQLTALINPVTATLSGAIPAFPNNTTTFFRGDGTYAAVAIGGVSGFGSGVATALGNTAGGAGGFALVGTTPPTGSAGGDLTGTYPNPTLNTAISTAVAFSGLSNTNLLTGSTLGWNSDTILQRDGAADTLGLYRGTNLQQLNVYATRTSATVWRRFEIGGNSGSFMYVSNGGAAGASFDFGTGANNSSSVFMNVGNTRQWNFDSSNNFTSNVGTGSIRWGSTSSFPALGRSGTSIVLQLGDGTLLTPITSVAAATLQLGAANAASPIAQTLQVQSVVAGTNNTSGVNWTFVGSLSTGSGTSGDIIFQTGGTGAGATTQNTATTALTIKGATQQANFAGALTAVGSLTFGTATAGIVLKQGSNGNVGTFVCNGTSTVTVNNTNVAISDAIIMSLNTVGGTVGFLPSIKTITAGSGFTLQCTLNDTSTYNYALIKNAA